MNKKIPSRILEIFSKAFLDEVLEYDQYTGALKWKCRGRHMFDSDRAWKSWNTRYAGKDAGRIYSCPKTRKKAYKCRTVGILGRSFQAHRIIWVMMTGEEPPEEIDHIDQDGTNNRWINLRGSTRRLNSRNIGLRTNNTSGIIGVGLHCCGRWRARIMIDGKEKHLGLFDDKFSAERAVIDARRFYGIQGQGD